MSPKATNDLSFENTAIAFAGKSDKELKKANFLFRLFQNGFLVEMGGKLTKFAFDVHLLIKRVVKYTIYEHFCGGESLKESLPTIDKLAENGVSTILDYGLEAKESEEEFDKAMEEQVRAIQFANSNADVPYISCKVTAYATFRLLRKLHKDEQLSKSEEAELDRLISRLYKICDEASKSDTAVYVDAEESWIQDGIDDLVDELMARYNKERPVVFNTYQLYRHDRLEFLKKSIEKAEAGGYILGAKLVRGAYMEKERDRAKRKGYPSPIQPDKAATDRDFDLAVEYCLDHIERVSFCAATHNEESSMKLARMIAARGLSNNHPNIRFAQLLGMSDHISFNLAEAGYNASKYVPYGPVKDVIPYLIRRAEENTSVAGQMGRELALIKQEVERRKR